MSNRNDFKTSNWSKLKWVQTILFLAAFAVTVALMIFSVLSYVQTEIAFRPFNDPTLLVFGFPVGMYASHLFAMIFQYGQNVALAYRAMMPRDNFHVRIFSKNYSDRDFALWFFIASAVIDAGTNILWMESIWTPSGIFVRDTMVRFVGWSVCIISVFFEELIGVVIDIWAWVGAKLKDIYAQEAEARDSARNSRERGRYTQPENNTRQDNRKSHSLGEHTGTSSNNQRVRTKRPGLSGSFSGSELSELLSAFEEE